MIPSMEHFTWFVNERESIRERKEAGEPLPYTSDPILSEYRFCNVRRRDDKVSRWLLDNYYPLAQQDVWLWATIARLINWPPSLKALIDAGVMPASRAEFRAQPMIDVMIDVQSRGKAYTGAYMLFAGGAHPRFAGLPKPVFIFEGMVTDAVAAGDAIEAAVECGSVRSTVEQLTSVFGISEFSGGQIAADLTYLPGQLADAVDLNTYAPRGPGSIRGLNRLHARKLSYSPKVEAFEKELIEVHTHLTSSPRFSNLTLHDVQNCFCEYDKYVRVYLDEGRPRARYTAETAF